MPRQSPEDRLVPAPRFWRNPCSLASPASATSAGSSSSWAGFCFLFAAVVRRRRLQGRVVDSAGGLSGTDSQAAFDLLKSEFPAQAGEDSAFVFGDISKDSGRRQHLPGRRPPRSRASASSSSSRRSPPTGRSPPRPSRSSPSGEDARTAAAVERAEEARRAAVQDSGGVAFTNWRFDEMEMPASEGLGMLAAVVVLLVAFGSVLAMGLPIITAPARHRHRQQPDRRPRPLHEHARTSPSRSPR